MTFFGRANQPLIELSFCLLYVEISQAGPAQICWLIVVSALSRALNSARLCAWYRWATGLDLNDLFMFPR